MIRLTAFSYQPTLPFAPGSDTSREAAEAMRGKAPSIRERVLQFIRDKGQHGATDDEIMRELHLNPNTARPRRVDLWHDGLIKQAGFQRLTTSKSRADVWVIA